MPSLTPTASAAAPRTAGSGLLRLLYSWYYRGAALGFFFSRRLRPAGAGLVVVIVLTAGLGFGHRRIPVFQLFSFAVGMSLISVPWAAFRRANLRATRELPRYATAGEPVRYTIHVTNRSNSSLHRAWLAETPPDPRPGKQEFVFSREPGEETRNGFDRFFAYYRWRWLLDGRRAFDGGTAGESMDLPARGTSGVSLQITPIRRGVIRLADLRTFLPDPFGLVQSCTKVPAPPATLTVLPRRFRLPALEMPGSSCFQAGDENATNSIGSTGEFIGLREYRPGDPIRQIHWKSWARTGRPIVKELEDTFFPRYGLILDTHLSGSTAAVFEDAVSVAASFVAMIDRGDCLLDLMFVKNEAHHVTAGRGIARSEKLLEVLAGVEGDHEDSFDDLSRLVLLHREDLTSAIVVFTGWDRRRADFLNQLSRQGVACVPLVVGEGPKPASVPGYWLETGNIANNLLALPRELQAFQS